MVTAQFSAVPGRESYAIPNEGCPGLQVTEQLAINGETDLSDIIRFTNGGHVSDIRLDYSGGMYQYIIIATGSGPLGLFGGLGHLYFTDATGDVYYLSLFWYSEMRHTLCFDSDRPTITKIEWKG